MPVAIYWFKKEANMNKIKLRLGTVTPKLFKLLCISMSLVFILIMSGCITPHALDLAERKSSPAITYTDWNLKKVWSAMEVENGDISLFVELYESDKMNNSECFEITLPNYSLIKETTDIKTLGFREKEIVGQSDRYAPDPYIKNYLYPLAKAEKGCQKLESQNLPTDSALPIVKLRLPKNDSVQLYTLLNELKAHGSPKEKLYEVKFFKSKDDSSSEMNEYEGTKYADVLLIYRPSGVDQEIVQPIGIAGGYESEDESTSLYYLLVPPAVMIDAIGLMVAAAAYRPM